MDNIRLVQEIISLPNETQWVEFKHSNFDPNMIGQDISALANGAALCERETAYMVWGIDDKSHEIIGTRLSEFSKTCGNQELGAWLRQLLSKNAEFEFEELEIDGKALVLLTIAKAKAYPVSFKKESYIRNGSYTKRLGEFPNLEAQLWDKLRNTNYEKSPAKSDLSETQISELLDYDQYFVLSQKKRPQSYSEHLNYLENDGVIFKQDNGLFSITRLGALLFARDFQEFPDIRRKALRLAIFQSDTKLSLLREITFEEGYISAFQRVLDVLKGVIPVTEVFEGAERKEKTAYPEIAIREAIANALIHQDFTINGTGPVIEVFATKIVISNPGCPLIDPVRIIDMSPRTRNEKLATLMRRMHQCEELGTGWDKIAYWCEKFQLPAPSIETINDITRVTLYTKRPFAQIPPEHKKWACYLHACMCYEEGKGLTNTSLRERFGLSNSASAMISRLIKETLEAEQIKPLDPKASPRYMQYVPYWA